jgi:hypothetical protein
MVCLLINGHVISSNGALMASKIIITKKTLVHDIIIKELNVQGGKASVQGGMIKHHLSEWGPRITNGNVLH